MWKAKKLIGILVLIAVFVFTATLISDKAALRQQVIRLHVVAASDSPEDQMMKLQVRDAVLTFLQQDMGELPSAGEVKAYLLNQLPQIQQVANEALSALGSAHKAVVTFLEEEFATKNYDTFRLPAGIYESLRITIGEGKGENWWCVVFPSLCIQASADQVQDVAAGSGFSGPLTGSITGENGYEIRFYFLELLGKIENFFHRE